MKHIAADILRIIDANLNRTGEGLRVLEANRPRAAKNPP